jgi:hypothetical protein
MPRSLAVEPILQYLFARPEGDYLGAMRLELGVEFVWELWLHELVNDLVIAGVLVRDLSRDVYGPPYYKLSMSTWLKMAQEEAECRNRRS